MKRTIILTEEQINTILNKKPITVLWLDDVRDPQKYLMKKADKESGALDNNLKFYNDFKSEYEPKFVWVRTFEEFTDYILEHGVPEFVSFDHDLGKGLKKGAECAAWLKNYCAREGKPLPKFYAHSANPNGRREINSVMLSEMNEDVFADKSTIRGRKNKMVNLTYKQHSNRNVGNLSSTDMLGTDKMDVDNEDTYIVDLKGGIKSYNITSIKGEAVMHYFKNKFKGNGSTTKIKAGGNEYELMMEEPEFQRFMNVFNNKVNRVVNYCINEFKKKNNEFEPSKVSIYPVPSSSNFNNTMAQVMSRMSLGGLPVRVANDEILKKDLRNLKRDEEFIEKNRDYFYNKPMSYQTSQGGFNKPVINFVDRDVNKRKTIKDAEKYIEEMNAAVTRILGNWSSFKNSGSQKTLKRIADDYAAYYDAMRTCVSEVSFVNPVSDSNQSSVFLKTVAKILKSSKPKSIEKRSGEIWAAIAPYMRGRKSPVTGKPYKRLEINRWEPQNFEIKNLSNGERMGMRNIYNPNMDVEFVQNEINEIKGGVLVIFDDNISGGATLADVCYQFKDMGVEYLIPITFGQMSTKWVMNMIPLSRPTNDAGVEGFNY